MCFSEKKNFFPQFFILQGFYHKNSTHHNIIFASNTQVWHYFFQYLYLFIHYLPAKGAGFCAGSIGLSKFVLKTKKGREANLRHKQRKRKNGFCIFEKLGYSHNFINIIIIITSVVSSHLQHQTLFCSSNIVITKCIKGSKTSRSELNHKNGCDLFFFCVCLKKF